MTTRNPNPLWRRTSRWRNGLLGIAAALFMAPAANAQVSYSNNFDANSTGWTGNFTRSTAQACQGTNSMRRNVYTPTVGNLVSPTTGTAAGGLVTLTYEYKIYAYSGSAPAPTPWGSFAVQYGATASGPWTTIATITDEAQTASCIPKSHTFTPPVGAVFLRWTTTWTAGDNYWAIDNIVAQEALPPCAGTPAPGNTTGPAAVSSGGTVNLGLQNPTVPGGGLVYQWYVSTTSAIAGFNPVGPNAATYSPTQTAQSWYYATVDCGGNVGTSNVLQVDMIYCTPAPTSVDGTGITRVVYSTVDNPTGAEVGNYGNYSAMVGDITQGTTANVDITYSTGATYDTKIWVDWNDDKDFDDVGENVYTGVSLAASPTTLNASFAVGMNPLGNHRMRIGGRDLGAPTPCYTGTWGSYEDYTVNVIADAACTGTPAPGATTGPATVCDGDNFNLGLTNATTGSGVSYQWYVSTTSAVAGFSPVGPDADVYPATQSVQSWYYCDVTCSAGPLTGTSGVLQVDMTAPFICNLCIPAVGGSDVEPICSVSFGSMSNPTCSAANCDAGYVDYTGTVTPPTVLQGQTYSLGVSGNTNGSYTTYMTAFFDWDQDGTFEDVQPIGSINNEVCVTTLTLNVNIPATSTGLTLMRIIKNYNSSPTDPCGTYNYGQAEDYFIDVQVGSCTPAAATATVTNINCIAGTYTVTVDVTGLGDATDLDIESSANGGLIAGGNDVGTGTYTTPAIPMGTPTTITVVHNQDNVCDLGVGNYNYAIANCPTIVTCGSTTNDTYCYGNNESGTEFAYQASSAFPLQLVFNAGYIEQCCDYLLIYDGPDNTGTLLYDSQVDQVGNDLTGLSVTAPSGDIFMEFSSDGSVNCSTSFNTPWDYDIDCLTCSPPSATATVIPACPGGFGVDVNISNFGSGSSATISYSVNSNPQTPINVGVTGTTNLTGFANGDDVDITVEHDSDPVCNLSFNNNTYVCPPANDLCANAIPVSCNTITNASTVNSTNAGAPASCNALTINSAGGIWYTVAGFDGSMTFDLSGSSFDTKIAAFTGTCGALVCVDSDDDGGTGATSLLTWAGSSAETYTIYVTGYSTYTGSVTMAVTCGDNAFACTENGLTLEFQTDANPGQTTWQLWNEADNLLILSGGPLSPPNSVETNFACVPDGCYRLRVLDSGGDGMTTGGYILRTTGSNLRIIDNKNNFNGAYNGNVSTLGSGAFCFPMDVVNQPIYSSCDKLDWVTNKFIVAAEDPAVTAAYATPALRTSSGYLFWFFDPNGAYSYRRFRKHSESDGYGTGALRANHFRINSWVNTAGSPHLPDGMLLNVRIMGRVNWSWTTWGPACQFKMDAALAACPRVNLQDNPALNEYSCNVNRVFGGSNHWTNRVTASQPQPVPGVSSSLVRYQFRFRIPGEAICIVRPPQTSPRLYMNWSADSGLQLECGKQYEVDVRVSLDGGANWCFDVASPSCVEPVTTWGNVCMVNITTSTYCPGPLQGGSSSMATQNGDLTMYPNPNRGDQLYINLSAVDADVNTVSVDIYDLTGKRISARTIAVQDGFLNSVLDLNGEIASGLYMVNITAGDKIYTERLVIQK
ncbi:MAG: T9SS type A sorting domain-containing protein [Flavobacteriales bacterium]|nr:T9SS type A sorting domain-containing protein [Flavobacteriales bacterium]